MRKTVLSGIVILLSGAWATAQPTQPGYSFVTSSPKSPSGSAVVVPTAVAPPEPGVLSGGPVGNGYPSFPMGSGPGVPSGMGAPMGPPPGMSYGPDPGMYYGSSFPGGNGTGFALDPPSSFGTETVWITGRYLYGYLSRGFLSTPLVTVGSTADLHPGGLGQASTVVVFGNDQYQYGWLNGAQLDVGVNLNDRFYLEASAMYFAPQHTNALIASDAGGNPFIGRPVFNTLFAQERSYLTSSPGLVNGSTSIESRLQLFSIEANARYQVNLTPYLSVDGLLGYRRMQLEEDLTITDHLVPTGGTITFLGTPIASPNTLSDFDKFSTTNQFNGVNTGARFRWQSGFEWLAFTGYGKLAVGATRQTVDIEGASSATTATGTVGATGGVLALSSNIGSHQRTVFGMIPEGGAGLVFLPCRGVRLHAGYSATYWNNVVRPGDQIDRRVNPALVPTDVNFGSGSPGAFPAFTFRSRAVWLQTLNFGVEFYY
jgi:hypothetical protein